MGQYVLKRLKRLFLVILFCFGVCGNSKNKKYFYRRCLLVFFDKTVLRPSFLFSAKFFFEFWLELYFLHEDNCYSTFYLPVGSLDLLLGRNRKQNKRVFYVRERMNDLDGVRRVHSGLNL